MPGCQGCGGKLDTPWGYCTDCASVLLDLSREPKDRINQPPVIEAQVAKMRAYEKGE